ncbi:chemokine (C-X-C motif) ligand 10 [Cricetulus griseus]
MALSEETCHWSYVKEEDELIGTVEVILTLGLEITLPQITRQRLFWGKSPQRTASPGEHQSHTAAATAAAAAAAAAVATTEMNMKGMAIALAVIICATTIQGFSVFKRGRCLCIGPLAKAVKMADIETVSILHRSYSCDKVEVIQQEACTVSTMNASAVLLFCLILLSLSGTQGIPLSRTVRCSCIKIDDRPVKPRALGKLEIIPASQSCPRVEIIVTMKRTEEKRCLNPESEAIKNLLKAVSQRSLWDSFFFSDCTELPLEAGMNLSKNEIWEANVLKGLNPNGLTSCLRAQANLTSLTMEDIPAAQEASPAVSEEGALARQQEARALELTASKDQTIWSPGALGLRTSCVKGLRSSNRPQHQLLRVTSITPILLGTFLIPVVSMP